MPHDEDAYFDVDSRLLFQLGEKLVANRAVALAELVKNSYDADATKVTVRMHNIKSLGGTIIIEDNGLGMTLQGFKKSWMRIATGDKENNPISKKYRRQKSGEKGIGRFACRRLAKKLMLTSVADTEDEKIELKAFFNWDEFTPGSDVDKIPVKYSTKKVEDDEPTGTILILQNTYDSWDGRNIRRLRNELTELISPFTYIPADAIIETPRNYDPGFVLNFDCPEFPTKEQRLDETFFKNAWAKLSGFVDENGIATYKIRVLNKIVSRINKEFRRSESFKFLKNSNFEIYAFSYRSDLFNDSEWNLNQTRVISTERGGIKVYADNFRVFGYGREGDDWLKLDYDRARSRTGVNKEVSSLSEVDARPGLSLFRNNNLFGHVVFSKQDNPELEITINRESLLENEAFEELRSFVRLGVDYATVWYSNEIYKEQQLKEEIKKKQIEEEEERRRRKVEEEAKKQKRKGKRQRKKQEKQKKKEERQKKKQKKQKKKEEELNKTEEELKKKEEESNKKSIIYEKTK